MPHALNIWTLKAPITNAADNKFCDNLIFEWNKQEVLKIKEESVRNLPIGLLLHL